MSPTQTQIVFRFTLALLLTVLAAPLSYAQSGGILKTCAGNTGTVQDLAKLTVTFSTSNYPPGAGAAPGPSLPASGLETTYGAVGYGVRLPQKVSGSGPLFTAVTTPKPFFPWNLCAGIVTTGLGLPEQWFAHPNPFVHLCVAQTRLYVHVDFTGAPPAALSGPLSLTLPIFSDQQDLLTDQHAVALEWPYDPILNPAYEFFFNVTTGGWQTDPAKPTYLATMATAPITYNPGTHSGEAEFAFNQVESLLLPSPTARYKLMPYVDVSGLSSGCSVPGQLIGLKDLP